MFNWSHNYIYTGWILYMNTLLIKFLLLLEVKCILPFVLLLKKTKRIYVNTDQMMFIKNGDLIHLKKYIWQFFQYRDLIW